MIELADGVFIAPKHVTMIQSISKEQCVVFFVGEGALEGHVIDYPAEEVVEVVNDYVYGEEEPEEEDESASDE